MSCKRYASYDFTYRLTFAECSAQIAEHASVSLCQEVTSLANQEDEGSSSERLQALVRVFKRLLPVVCSLDEDHVLALFRDNNLVKCITECLRDRRCVEPVLETMMLVLRAVGRWIADQSSLVDLLQGVIALPMTHNQLAQNFLLDLAIFLSSCE